MDLIKARPHKYIKRTGAPGNYKYWYKLPDGRVVSSDDASSPVSHSQAKIEHLHRLILAKKEGHHSMSKDQMMRHTGVSQEEMNANGQKHLFANAHRRGHADFEAHEKKEAHENEWNGSGGGESAAPASPRERLLDAARRHREAAEARGPDPGRTITEEEFMRPRRRRRARTGRAAGDIPETDETPRPSRRRSASRARAASAEAEAASASGARAARAAATTAPAPAATPVTPENYGNGPYSEGQSIDYRNVRSAARHHNLTPQETRFLEQIQALNNTSVKIEGGKIKINSLKPPRTFDREKENAGVEGQIQLTNTRRTDDGPMYDMEYKTDHATQAADAAPAAAPAPAGRMSPDQLREMRERLAREHGVNLGPTEPAVVAESATRAREAARRAASTSSAAAVELHQEDPALAAADAPLARMEEAERRGENPYLSRAKEIFDNIQGDLKPERADVVKHMFQAMQQIQDSGQTLSKANLLSAYKSISGRSRVQNLDGVGAEFEKGTFMSLDEIVNNEPLDLEVERMKRGYAAKQFARLKPFLKESFTRANPSAPPPMPTWGDIKTWTEHGHKPDWAGNTRTALPRDVFDAAAKGPDGKPKYPPEWMPVHLMPVWNYIVKKAGDENPYQTRIPITRDQRSTHGWKIDAGSQAGYQEGIAKNAIRKYVQMRGGADQLTDIPKHKLAEVGLTHSDIFKGDEGSDEHMNHILKHKIVDPCSLLPFVKEAMHSIGGDDVKKSIKTSFELVVDENLPPVSFKKSYTIDLKKAELIKKIKALKKSKYVVRT